MVLLEDQHRAETNSRLSASSNVNSYFLALLQDSISLRAIPCNKGTLSLTTQVLELARIFLRKPLKAREEIVTRSSGVFNQVKTLDLVDDGAEDDGTSRVAHPGVELAVWLVGAQGWVSIIVACSLGFLGEGDDVGRGLEVPVLVGPEFAGGADAGLDFVDDEEDVVALGDVAEALEEGGRGVVVASLGLDGFNYDGCDGVVEFFDEALGFGEAALFFLGVLGGELVEWVFEGWEGGSWPVEGGDVEFVDWLAAGG